VQNVPAPISCPARRAVAGALRPRNGWRGARGYITPQPNDFHTNLGWDDKFGGLVTHPLPDGSRLGLRIADLTLAFLDQHPHALRSTAAPTPR